MLPNSTRQGAFEPTLPSLFIIVPRWLDRKLQRFGAPREVIFNAAELIRFVGIDDTVAFLLINDLYAVYETNNQPSAAVQLLLQWQADTSNTDLINKVSSLFKAQHNYRSTTERFLEGMPVVSGDLGYQFGCFTRAGNLYVVIDNGYFPALQSGGTNRNAFIDDAIRAAGARYTFSQLCTQHPDLAKAWLSTT